ncbi:WSC-domain-containing protein, partial [Trametes sanguinea]
MFSKLVSLAALAAVANAEHWIFGGTKLIAQTRLDSIVNPDALGTHVHAIAGASGFSNVYDPDTLVKSNCTTIPVQPDKSNYWAAQNGTLTPIPTSFNIYYLVRNGAKNAKINAFPKGLRMVAGDTNRRTYNASSYADQAVSYVCLDYNNDHTGDPNWAERPNFFQQNCPDGMRAQVFFPACWDGVNLDSPDHKSHVSYPVDAYNTGDCPDSHPVHLVSLFYEMLVSVDQFDYHGEGTWVLANGDTTGYGHHGDFQNGWDIDLLQEAIDTCTNANGNVMDCPPLAAVFDQAAADACVLEGSIVDEDIGLDAPISRLPGCNPIYGSGQAESCTDLAVPQLKLAQNPLPSGWSELGCIAEGTSGRALPALTMKDPGMTRAMCASYCGSHGYKLAGVDVPAGWTAAGCVSDNSKRALTGFSFSNDAMSVASCVSTCSSKGFSMAGVEFGRECYCGNSLQNMAGEPLPKASCNMPCGADSSSICGGNWAMSLFKQNTIAIANPSPAPSSASSAVSAAQPSASSAPSNSTNVSGLPAGWTAIGCASDVPARTLNIDAYTSEQMTINACIAHCAARGH